MIKFAFGNEHTLKGTTLVIGASTRPERFSYRAVKMLTEHGHPVAAIGLRSGEIFGVRIDRPFPPPVETDTVTMYVGPLNQHFYHDYILSLKPRRVIFNPGTECFEFAEQLAAAGVLVVYGCTLVMLASGEY